MADFDLGSLSPLLGGFANAATSQGFGYWISLGMNIILSTIVGGIVLLVLMEVLGKLWGENVNAGRVFIFLLVINVVNTFIVLGLLSPFVSFIPMWGLVVPLLLWIALMKLFFSELSALHAVITGIIGYAISLFVIPYLVGYVSAMLPI